MPTIKKAYTSGCFYIGMCTLMLRSQFNPIPPPTQPGPTVACTGIFILKNRLRGLAKKPSEKLFERESISG